MKLLHLANWNSTNIGNGALIYGTERVLREDIPDIEFVPEAWDDYTFKKKHFDEKFVELVNQHDGLLVNGAVTFNAFRRGYANTGMRLNLPMPLWEKIEKPIILYGLSYRCWPFQKYQNIEAFKRWLNYAISSEHVFFGVRNDGTKEWIRNRFGIDSEKIYEIPDPGLFVPDEDHDYPELHPTRKNIFIAFNGEDSVYRYATPIDEALIVLGENVTIPTRAEILPKALKLHILRRRAIVQEIARAVEGIAAQHDVQFIVVPHYLDDYGMIQEFIEAVQERVAHQHVVSTGLLSVPHTPYFYGRYAKADLALSMRIHSMSPSIGLGIPVIPLTSQGRMRNFLKKANLEDIGVDISQKNFGDQIVKKATELLNNPKAFTDRTEKSVKNMRDQLKSNNARITSLLETAKKSA